LSYIEQVKIQQEFEKLVANAAHIDKDLALKHIKRYSLAEELLADATGVFYIFNFTASRYEYISDGILSLSGYSKDEIQAHKYLLNLVDRSIAEKLVHQVFPSLKQKRNELKEQELKDCIFQFSFPFVKKNGEKVRILDQYHIEAQNATGDPALIMGRLIFLNDFLRTEEITASINRLVKGVYQLFWFQTFQQDLAALSKRELEILRLVADGETSKTIGELLYISEYTVNRHKQNMMEKLEVKNSNELVKVGVLNGVY
jgi:DNA-binding CsgD family transcriptional regulator